MQQLQDERQVTNGLPDGFVNSLTGACACSAADGLPGGFVIPLKHKNKKH